MFGDIFFGQGIIVYKRFRGKYISNYLICTCKLPVVLFLYIRVKCINIP